MEKEYTEVDLIGTWRCADNTHNSRVLVTITFRTDHVIEYVFRYENGEESTLENTWQYKNGILSEKSHGLPISGSFEWVDDDYFIITIIDNGSPAYKGVQRHYRRITHLLS
jgi:hypothetical protein